MRLLNPAVGAMLAVATGMAAETLAVRREGGNLTISTSQLDLLQGSILSRLKNGLSVAFDLHLSLWTGSRNNIRRRAFERFVVSYDLWEEKFFVSGLRKPRPTASGLSAAEVPAWCLKQISLPAPGLEAGTVYGVRLDVQLAKRGEGSEDSVWNADSTISIKTLIEIFSRPSRGEPDRWSLDSGPIREPVAAPPALGAWR
ncbi:MAG: hypothetical protein FJW20_22800 [Acidimicrobiia bacterium]|nr:hypothetical protein [Acidimicrobiia bacterium]